MKGKLAQVTQLQAIEESFKHLKISEILEFLFNNQCPLQCMNQLYIELGMKGRLFTRMPNGH